jgi:glycosyltransferase involved in cell wall biosynthesis
MISFIVIGRNEGCRLSKCLSSIYEVILKNSISDYEVIYVDSRSEDDSIQRAKIFPNIKIICLTGDYNAAIARNTGAKESRGEVLFFIDGDMEISISALPYFYNEGSGLKYRFCSGNFLNIQIGNQQELYYENLKDKFDYTVGGLFLIERQIWNFIGGMRPIFKRSQEIDLGLRLAKSGLFLFRKNIILAMHYTVMYNSPPRKWKMLIESDQLYGRALLYRMNLTNKYSYKRMIRNDFTFVMLFFSVLIFCLSGKILGLFVYLLAVILRCLFKNGFTKSLIIDLFYIPLRDIQQIFGFFFFWPRVPQNIKYELHN